MEKNAYLLVEGLPERIPVRVMSSKIRDQLLKTRRYSFEDGYDYDESGERVKRPGMEVIALESTRTLPANTRVQLVWGKGIKGARGSATSQDRFLAYRTQQEFIATFSCQRENAEAACLPIAEMYLQFNSMVENKLLASVQLKGGGATFKPEPSKEKYVGSLVFKGPFPPNTKFTLSIPKLKDDQGRPLLNQKKFPLEVSTEDYPPLAKFSAAFGILEAGDPVLPVTLRNVEANVGATKVQGRKISVGADHPAKLMGWISRLKYKDSYYTRYENDRRIDTRREAFLANESGGQKFTLPKPNGAQAFEVVGIPLGEKGFHIVELESQLLGQSLLGEKTPMYVAAGALVTNLSVHFKWGKENSLVWVTALDSGKPVKGARVRASDCQGNILWEGKSGNDGIARTEKIVSGSSLPDCNASQSNTFSSGLVIVAEKDGDFSLVHSSWDDGIETWRFQLPTGGERSDTVAHTVLDRTLFRAGQEVHMKHFLRERYLLGLRMKKEGLPGSLVLLHSTGKKIVLPLKFGPNGAAENSWKIPKNAELGNWDIYLTVGEQKSAQGRSGEEEEFRTWGKGVYHSGSFRVEEFRLPVMAGSLQWPSGAIVGKSSVSVDLNIRYLSGGGASGLPVRLRSRADRYPGLQFSEFEGLVFANGGVKTGRFNRADSSEAEKTEKILPDQRFTLDSGGAARANLGGIPLFDVPTRVQVEAEYRDPNGEVQSIGRSAIIYPTGALVGIQPDGWLARKEKVKFKIAVVSPEGKPLQGRKVKVYWLEKESFSHRKRIVGGFYAYENFEEIRGLGTACKGETDAKGFLFCEGSAPATGNLVLVAETEEGGKTSRSHHEIYVAGGEDHWFRQDNDDRIDLLPERRSYEGGDTAHLQVRSPFRSATALVTVEREGVIDAFVTEVQGSEPVIQVPVKASYAPNVFISALLVRGRVGEPKPTGLVDLAKPAHKLGITEISVGWKAHRLNVSVETDRSEYRVREKAKVKVRAVREIDGKPASGGEVLLAAVDEALLGLRPNQSWKLLEEMMGKRALQVNTCTAQSQVVGKRHFGLKALPTGGGGGQSSARELFDTLLFWKAILPLNSRGEAEAEVPMNDSLSSFRIVAVASEGADRFGTGERSVATRQDLSLFSGISPLARHGDKIQPEVTVRNSGNGHLKADVSLKVDGRALRSQAVSLQPGEAKAVVWEMRVPPGGESQAFEFEAKSGSASDALKVIQKLEPPLRETVVQSTLERLEGKLVIPVELAKGALPGMGRVGVRLSPTLGANLAGVINYMKEYPWNCLEQQTSKAVALRDKKLWASVRDHLSSYVATNGLLKYFPESYYGSDSLTSYVLQIAQEAGYDFPSEQLPKVMEGLRNFVTGRSYFAGFQYPAADIAIRKLTAMDALSRYGSFDPAWISLIQIEPQLWPMRALLDWYNLLQREQKIPDRAQRLAEVQQILRARIEWRGTVVGFKGGSDLWWLMGSMDEEANRLLLAASSDDQWKAEIGRLVRGSIGRMKKGRWDLTTANAWGVLAMERFSSIHEKDPVSGSTQAVLAGKKEEVQWAPAKESASLSFPWPAKKADLELSHQGGGKPWAQLDARAAIRLSAPIFKGYRVKRTVTPVEQKRKGSWSVGDIYRVTLAIEAPADMTWVVVADPVPAGATVLGSGLGNDSSFLTKGEKRKGWSWGTFEERSFSGYRAYHEWMPKGSHQLEYTVRLNAAGSFQLPNTRVEAMYAPEMYAEVPNENVSVGK